MTKEEVLELLKHLVLQLRDHSKDIQSNPNLMQDWVAKTKYLEASLKSLNPSDTQWVNHEYSIWHDKAIKPHISKIDPKILKMK